MYSYDENFVSNAINSFKAKQFLKKVSLSSFIIAALFIFVSLSIFNKNTTGTITASSEIGCCVDNAGICHESNLKGFCNSEEGMHMKYDCFDLPYCSGKTAP